MQELCVTQVAGSFEQHTLPKVPNAYHTQIVQQLPLDLPLELAGQAIRDEAYWKRRSQARWTNCDALKHGGSYKQLFFERNLQDTLEECAPRLRTDQNQQLTALELNWAGCAALYCEGVARDQVQQLCVHAGLTQMCRALKTSSGCSLSRRASSKASR